MDMISNNIDYMKVQNEIIDRLIRKSNIEWLHFLELDMGSAKEAEQILLRFKYNIKAEMYRHEP